MVGLPDSAVKESHQRILSALQVTECILVVSRLSPKDKGGSMEGDRKSTRLNSSHLDLSRMPSSA